MTIAGISLNRVSIGILNRTSSAYGGLTLGASALTTTRNQALDNSAISTPPTRIVAAPADTAASRKTLLNSLGSSLTDLRASLAGVQEKANDASITQTAQYGSEQRYKDQDITAAQTTYRQQDVFENRDRFETRTTYDDRDVYETRNTYGTRDVYETQNTYGTRGTYETRDVFSTENVYETRDVYESRAVYQQQAIYATNVTGSRSLTPYSSTTAAGIDVGADLAVTVGSGQKAVVKFSSVNELSVTANGKTTKFSFNDGSFKTTLATALNTVSGLSASIASDGKLHLTTANAQPLTIADVANQLLDLSGSPLAALGLTAGTTNSSVVGYDTVQTGTEQVKTGTQQVLVGTRQVKTGTEQVQTGTEQYVTGTQQVVVGTEQYVTGTEQVKTGTEHVAIGTEQVKVGTDRVKIGTEQVEDGVRNIKIGTRRVEDGSEAVLIGFQTPTGGAALDAALTPQAKIDISTAARKIVDAIGADAFDSIRNSVKRSTGPDASEGAVALLNALTEASLTNASSPDRLTATLDTVDKALHATETLKSATAPPAPSSLQSTLLSLLSFASADKTDAASLLIHGIAGYNAPSTPFYGSGSATAIGSGVIRINSLV